MKALSIFWTLFTFIALFAFIAGCASERATSQQLSPLTLSQEDRAARQNLDWVNQPWTGDDKPYKQIKDKIDNAISSGTRLDVLRVQYERAAEKQREDPQAQFAWAYATWKMVKPTSTASDVATILYGVPEALARVPYPRAYDFARLRFLVESQDPRFRLLGERLLRQAPSDNEVKEHLIGIYVTILFRSDIIKLVPPGLKQTAVTYAQDMIRSEPNNPRYYANLGWIYLASWHRHKNQQDGDQAIANFRGFLRLAPANDEWRKSAENFIHMIQSQQ